MIERNLYAALFALGAFIVVMGVLGYAFEGELAAIANWVVDRIGFAGLALILMVTDTLVTPFPPDILLVVVAKSPLAEDWPVYVGILGMVSVTAGMTGFGIGRWLGHFEWSKKLFGQFKEDHEAFIRRYGFWAVAIGSVTPLPYSVTCWSAGVLGVPGTHVLAAAVMFRIPRIFSVYWLLSTTGNFFTMS